MTECSEIQWMMKKFKKISYSKNVQEIEEWLKIKRMIKNSKNFSEIQWMFKNLENDWKFKE